MSLGTPNSLFGSRQAAPNAPHGPGLQPQQEPHAQPQPQQELHEPVRQPQQHWSKRGFPEITIIENKKWKEFPHPLLLGKPRQIVFDLWERTLIQNFHPCGTEYKNRWVYVPESILQIGKGGSALYMRLGGAVDCIDVTKDNKPTRFRVVEQNGTKTLQQLHGVDSNTSEEVWKPAINTLTYHDFYETKFDEFIVQSGPKSSDHFGTFCNNEGISNYHMFGSLWWTANTVERRERAEALESAAATAVGGGKEAVEDTEPSAALRVETPDDAIEDDDDGFAKNQGSVNDEEFGTAAKRTKDDDNDNNKYTSKETAHPSGLQEAAKKPSPNASDIVCPHPEAGNQEDAAHGGDDGRDKSTTARVLSFEVSTETETTTTTTTAAINSDSDNTLEAAAEDEEPYVWEGLGGLPHIPKADNGFPDRRELMQTLRAMTNEVNIIITASKYLDQMLSMVLPAPPDKLKDKIDAMSEQLSNSQSPMKDRMHWIRVRRNRLGHVPNVNFFAQVKTTKETVLALYQLVVCYLEALWVQKQETQGLRSRIRQLQGQVQETDGLRRRIRALEDDQHRFQNNNESLRSRIRQLEDQLRSRQNGNGGFASPRAHHHDSAGRQHLEHQRNGNYSGDRRPPDFSPRFSGNRGRNDYYGPPFDPSGPRYSGSPNYDGSPGDSSGRGRRRSHGSAGHPSHKRQKRDT